LTTLTSAILCEFAQVRESMLVVVGGCITRVRRESLPAPLGVMLALVMEIPAGEQAQVHEIVVAVKRPETAEDVLRVVGGVQLSSEHAYPGESLQVPLAFDLRDARVEAYGGYDVVSHVDGNPGPMLTFYVVDKPEG